jgi:hypothetical protein
VQAAKLGQPKFHLRPRPRPLKTMIFRKEVELAKTEQSQRAKAFMSPLL